MAPEIPTNREDQKERAHHLAGLCQISALRVHEWLLSYECAQARSESRRLHLYAGELRLLTEALSPSSLPEDFTS